MAAHRDNITMTVVRAFIRVEDDLGSLTPSDWSLLDRLVAFTEVADGNTACISTPVP